MGSVGDTGLLWVRVIVDEIKNDHFDFHMNKTHPFSTPMVDWSFNIKKDHFRPQEEDKEILGLEIPYLSAIDTLIYLANCT